MIIVKGRELLIPENERYIGTNYDAGMENRLFRIPRYSQSGTDLSDLVFKINLIFDGDPLDRAEMAKEIDDDYIYLTWAVTAEQVAVTGTVFVCVTGNDTNDTVKWSSFQAAFYTEKGLGDDIDTAYHELVDRLDREIADRGAAVTAEKNARQAADTTLQQNIDAEAAARAAADTAANRRIDNIVAQSGTDNTEIVDARIGADGTTYTVLKNRLDAENANLKGKLTAELLNGNAFDILPLCVHQNVTHNGVTFTWNDGKCSVSGTASGGAAFSYLFHKANAFPMGMVPGGTYRIKYNSEEVLFQVYKYVGGVVDNYPVASVKTDRTFTLPSDCSGLLIRLAVPDGITASETVHPMLFTETLTNQELTEIVNVVDNSYLVVDSHVAKSADGIVLNELYQVDDWETYAYVDENDGIVKPTTTIMSASKNLIPIPAGTSIHVHGALKIFLYESDGSFIESVTPSVIDTIISSDTAAFIRIQYGSIAPVTLGFYVAYRYAATKEEQGINAKTDIVTNGVQYPGITLSTKTGNPLVLTDCDDHEPFDIFTLSDTPSDENIVICGKNLFALRHVNGTFTRNNVLFTFNTILNTIRIRSTGASGATISGFTEFGDEFKTVNGSTFYHNFKFRFQVETRVSVSDNANQEVPFDFGVQMRVYDGTNIINCGTGGVSFVAEADTEYVVYFLVKEGWSGDITYSPQIEIGDYPTAYERFAGIKAELTDSGSENIFQCGGTAPGRYNWSYGGANLVSLFDSATNEVYVDAENDSNNVIIYDTTKDGIVNGQAFNYIFKFTPGAVPVYVRGFDKKYAKLLYAQISDGTTTTDDFKGNGIYFFGEAGKEYGFRIGIRGSDALGKTTKVNAVVKPIIATGFYALKDFGTYAGTTVLYTDGDTALTVRQRQMSTKAKAAQNHELTKAVDILTGGHIYTPFGKLNARGPMVSFIDDDTWNLYCVQRYHDIFAAKSVLGGYAVITENMVTNPSTMQPADPNLLPTLLEYEQEGFAMLYHCHDQNGANTRYWIKGDPSYDQSLINDNFMSGLRAIRTMGFSNYKYWITPYGVNDKYIQDLAKNHGMQCLFNCPSAYAQEGFVSAHGNVSRWNIPRVIFGNYTNNDAFLHRVIQSAKAAKGWVIIVSHVNSWGAAGSETNIALGNRLSALIQYCLDEGLEIVPAPVAFEEYRAAFLMNELF